MSDTHLRINPGPKLMESIRSLGYTPEVAVADVIDNSLDAGSSRIEVGGDVSDIPEWLWIADDGTGMTIDQMADALRLGAVSSLDSRGHEALGRFGLGLKTASFSQCRSLSLVSKKDGETNAVCFDLDELQATGDWTVRRLEPQERAELPGAATLEDWESGTLVCWQKLDRLMGDGQPSATRIGEVLSELRSHLSLTFHRWLAPESSRFRKVELLINGRPVEPRDPFLRHNPAVEMTDPERIASGDDQIVVQAFTLPDGSRITGPDAEREDLGEGMYAAQGFYFYRNRRLISHGGWANLGSRRDATKHSRILVDLPSSADEMWQLDVMKNKVVPPTGVRRQLNRFYGVGRKKSERVISYRGRRVESGEVEYAWIPIEERGGFRYEPNEKHPILADALADLDPRQQKTVLKAIRDLGLLIPYAEIRRRMSVDGEIPHREQEEALVQYARSVVPLIGLDWNDMPRVEQVLSMVDPFSGRRDLKRILERAAMTARTDGEVANHD